MEVNNSVHIQGTIIKEPEFNHENHGERFYDIIVSVPRLSGETDEIPVIVSERLNITKFHNGDSIALEGQYRSYNKSENVKSKLILSVFARQVVPISIYDNPNIINLTGYICKEPVYRETPFNREITDVLIAVNRAYHKSDYIPCLAWGRTARYIAGFEVGDKVEIVGRIQSRKYHKKYEDGTVEDRVAYEVSILTLTKLPNDTKPSDDSATATEATK